MAFTFTRAAYLDKRNEDVSIVLENALVQGRFWLPRRQEVEVRRTGTYLDFPARGIIRGRWDIGEYDVNDGPADRDVRRARSWCSCRRPSVARTRSRARCSTRSRPTCAS